MAVVPVFDPARFTPSLPYQTMAVRQGTFTGIQANGVARYELVKGLSYHCVNLRFSAAGTEATKAQIAAQVAKIRIMVDGEEKWSIKPAYLQNMNDYWGGAKGYTSGDGYLLLDLGGILHLDPSAWFFTAWGTSDVNQLVVEVELTGTITNIDTIEAIPTYDTVERPLGIHRRLITFSESHAAASEDDVTSLPKDPGTGIASIHITPGAGAISKATLKVDNVDFFQDMYRTLVAQHGKAFGRAPVANYMHLDFNRTGQPLQFLPMSFGGRRVGDLRLKPTFSTTPNGYDILLETYEGFGTLAA